jgi:pilus assembly protein CpaF
MKLGAMLRQAGEDGNLPMPEEQPEEEVVAEVEPDQDVVHRAIDPLQVLKTRAQEQLFRRLGSRLYDSSMSQDQLQAMVAQELDEAIKAEAIPLSHDERHRLVTAVKDDILGYGPMEQFLADESVSEIMVNGDDAIYIERGGRLELTDARFVSNDHLRRVIDRIVSKVGRRIDESSPMCDARLPDGSRVNAIIPPLAVRGPALTIRKFAKKKLSVEDLVDKGAFTRQTGDFLEACVLGRLNILVSGGTGTGKTTMLNLLSGFIPDEDRIVTIEDSVEPQLRQRHVVTLETRPPNVEGKGAVEIRDLVKNSLRMRPDRIVVGECRGGETLDMLQAMNTGHEGSLSTVHANNARDTLSRVETMVLMAGMDLPVRAIREQVASAVDMTVQLN